MSRFLNGLEGNGQTTQSWIAALDVWETEDDLVYSFDLPGIPVPDWQAGDAIPFGAGRSLRVVEVREASSWSNRCSRRTSSQRPRFRRLPTDTDH